MATALDGLTPLSGAGSADTARSAALAATPSITPVAGAPAEGAWSPVFGAVDVGSTPFAVVVDGDVAYLGGDFTGVMAGMPQDTYQRIARWDGQAWSRLGDGLNGTVRAICVVGGLVVVGGEFTVAGGTTAAAHLARWDGERWRDLAGGVSYADRPMSATVQALASDGRALWVAGVFDRAGRGDAAVAASGIAAFDLQTETWSALGDGLVNVGSPGDGRALLVDGGRLLVGGRFDTAGAVSTYALAAVDLATGAWSGFGTGIGSGEFSGQVQCLTRDPDTGAVYAGGSFTRADTVPASGVVRLDGDRFTALGEFTYFGDPGTATVRGVAVAGGAVYAAGEFTTAGGSGSPNFAVLTGDGWSAPWAPLDNTVQAVATYGTGVIVAGTFMTSGDTRITSAGIWTGERWRTFGQGLSYDPYADANVFALSPAGDEVVVGGYFDQAGPVRVGSVARWTGTEWDPVGGGVRTALGLGKICAVARVGADLYVTGDFDSAGDAAAAHIARWDGQAWSAVGNGLNGTGYAFAPFGDRLLVGGQFSAAGDTPASGVALWDPATSTWAALGNAPVYDGAVLGLAVIADRWVVIGGEFNAFRQAGRDLVRGLNGLVLFDTQATLGPANPTAGYYLIPGVMRSSGTGTVRALHVQGDRLYAGGWFDTAGVLQLADPPEAGFAAQNLVAWDFNGDGTWSVPGGADQPVQAIADYDDAELLLAGHFATIGPVRADSVVRFHPGTGMWTPLGGGVGPGLRDVRRGEAVARQPGVGVWVGGTFNTAGGLPSCSIALWTEPAAGPEPG